VRRSERDIPEPWWADEPAVTTEPAPEPPEPPVLTAPSASEGLPRNGTSGDGWLPAGADDVVEPPPGNGGGDGWAPVPGGHLDGPPDAPPGEPPRSRVQFFIPAPEDLPPPETVFGPRARRGTGPADVPPPDPSPAPGHIPAPGPVADLGHVPDPGPLPGAGPTTGPDPDPDWYPAPAPGPASDPFDDVPEPPVMAPAAPDGHAFDEPPPGLPPEFAPDLDDERLPVAARRTPGGGTRPRPRPIDRRRLRTVYDIDGPRVRLGIAWFAGALVATVLSPITATIVYAAVAGLAARQIVRAWGSVSWQADVAAGMAAVTVVAALAGTPVAVGAAVVALLVAVGCAAAPDGSRMPGGEGRVAAVGILFLAMAPAVAGVAFVLVRAESVIAAVVLVVVASAYEVGDYIVGSGASNPVEGPLAGVTTATLVALPLALVLVEPYDAGGVALLAFTAVACPLGQIVGSAALPGAGAPAPALRRIDTLLVLALVWAAAAGAF
jgi:hypothetical protein